MAELEARPLGVRWTIGAVSAWGFEALRLSIHGARRVFGPDAEYVVCVNSLGLDDARARTGAIPRGVEWRDVTRALDPRIARHLDGGLAEGVGWKLAPVRVWLDRYELALDNDCILWALPDAIRAWLEGPDPDTCVLAEDTRAYFGIFADLCGSEPRNSGIRGLPPGLDYAAELERLLVARGAVLTSETDEQGLQVAAVTRARTTHVVRADEVTICSPFPAHSQDLGRAGAHFVGLNAHRLPWSFEGRDASELTRAHFARWRPALEARVGIAARSAEPVVLAG